MIRVRPLGHIRSALGSGEIELAEDEIEAGALVDRLRAMSEDKDPGFNKYNTLVMVEDGEAFVPAAVSKMVKDGDEVVLIPFSHGG